MGKKLENIDRYLKMTGQTFQYVMSGLMQYGPAFIDNLVEKALAENKKIVWKTKAVEGEDLGLCEYELKPIRKKETFRVIPRGEDLRDSIRKVMDEVSKEEIDESDPARRMKALMQGAEPKNDNEKKLLAEIKQMIAEGKIIDIPEM